MAVTILLEVKAKKGTGNDLLATMKAILPDTRSYDGCISLNVYQNQDDSDVIALAENFESKAHYEKYVAWRVETGVMQQLGDALAEPPSIRFFDLTDA
ncbi:MAG: antibiotic biosynthesis monooxygenase [Proteobacteria bacterium]|nr:antibiotic biosynthesis monooxygenase [Pseudomonadota bacterium]MDA1357849.1 antibiotic biosynthesis monooxygenase [Pseudomonadota bacterium]